MLQNSPTSQDGGHEGYGGTVNSVAVEVYSVTIVGLEAKVTHEAPATTKVSCLLDTGLKLTVAKSHCKNALGIVTYETGW